MLINGSFSDGETGWILTVLLPGQATGSVQDGEYAVAIANGGNFVWAINLKQENLSIENGKTYLVSFDAYADAPRQISALVGKNADPWTVYSGSQDFSVATSKQSYTYSFTMHEATDPAARLGFDLGLSTFGVYFDNISLAEDHAPTDIEPDRTSSTLVPTDLRLLQNYPNPFNPETRISYELSKQTKVVLKITNLLGQEIRTLVAEEQPAGIYDLAWDGRDNYGQQVASGVYLYRIEATGFVQVRKMVLLQ